MKTKGSGPTTAAELLAKLEKDPAYRARRDKKEREMQELDELLAADQAGLVAEIRDQGYDIDSVYDLVNNSPHPVLERRFVGPYPKAYPILAKHLCVEHHPRIREGIIRALTESDANEVASEALLREFENESDSMLRWVLANALRTVLSRSQKRKHPEYKDVLKGAGSS